LLLFNGIYLTIYYASSKVAKITYISKVSGDPERDVLGLFHITWMLKLPVFRALTIGV